MIQENIHTKSTKKKFSAGTVGTLFSPEEIKKNIEDIKTSILKLETGYSSGYLKSKFGK